MKRAIVMFALLGTFASSSAAAQGSVYFDLKGDSVFALIPGTTGSIDLNFYSYCYGLGAYSLTLGFDSTQVSLPSAGAVPNSGFPGPAVTSQAGSVDLAASGSILSCTIPFARTVFTLDPAATQGSRVTIALHTLTSSAYYGNLNLLPSTATIPLRICHATKIWGDFDQDHQITSRDALIALSDAVGLPVAGFDETVGDIDQDSRITSRDALFILTAGIGLDESRAGHGRADICPP